MIVLSSNARTLVVDTTGTGCHVGLYDAGGLVFEALEEGARRTAEVAPKLIKAALRYHQNQPCTSGGHEALGEKPKGKQPKGKQRGQDKQTGEIKLIAVITGPGSFTGIRAGLASVAGFAFGLGIRAVGIPTLEALAVSAYTPNTPAGSYHKIIAVGGVVTAGRDGRVAALFSGNGDPIGRFCRLSGPAWRDKMASLIIDSRADSNASTAGRPKRIAVVVRQKSDIAERSIEKNVEKISEKNVESLPQNLSLNLTFSRFTILERPTLDLCAIARLANRRLRRHEARHGNLRPLYAGAPPINPGSAWLTASQKKRRE